MAALENPFSGVRPSDLRFDNPHILGEYIARAQRFADSATRIEASAEQLVQGAMQTTQQGVKQFQVALRQMQSDFKALQIQLRRVVEAAGRDIAKAVADAHAAGASCILQAGEIGRQRYEELASRADAVNRAAQRLEKAADLADSKRQLANEEMERMRVFKSELAQYERDSLARLRAAEVSLYQGLGLWQRLCYVPFPPVAVGREVKLSTTPSAMSREARTPNIRAKVSDPNSPAVSNGATTRATRQK